MVRAGDALPEPPPGIPVSWLALTGCELLAGLRRYFLTDLTGPLLRLARPVVFLSADPPGFGDLPAGVSKFGGDPDLPAGTDWPADANGPLPFLAQLNLAELAGSPAAADLPPAGLLSVFYDGEGWGEGDGWRLAHTPGGVPLTRRATPAAAAREYLSATPPCRLIFTEGLDIPDPGSERAKDLDLRKGEYGRLRHEGYDRLRSDDRHRLLGYPRSIQHDGLTADRRHLLSLGSDDAPGWDWGNRRALCLTLPQISLAAGRLADGVRFEMQCS